MTTKTTAKMMAVGICSGLMAGTLRFTLSCRSAILRHSYAAIAAPRANNVPNAGARAQASCTSKRADAQKRLIFYEGSNCDVGDAPSVTKR
jgi:hypothetical protein